MDPDAVSSIPGCDAVVAAVPNALRFRSERGHETARDHSPVRSRPAHRHVVSAEVFRGDARCGIHTAHAMLTYVSAQDRFAQTTRAAVDEHHQLPLAESKSFESPGVQNFLNRLQLGEVIAVANSTEHF